MFKKLTITNIIEDQIAEAHKAYLTNRHNAEHWDALAAGAKATLERLRRELAIEKKLPIEVDRTHIAGKIVPHLHQGM